MFLYVFADKGIPDVCKIGTSSTHGGRYRQARCHNPRGIAARAFFDCGTTAASRLAESAAKRTFKELRRPGDAIEWFSISSQQAIDKLATLPELAGSRRLSNPEPKLKSGDILYDDWREQRDQYRSYKWRLFLFQEQSDDRYLKLSYGALYETAFRYVFTYNPYPVVLIAGFDDPAAPERETAANSAVNDRILHAWTTVQKEIGSLFAEEVGWLRAGATPLQVSQILGRHGLMPFDLSRAKPSGALPREGSLNPPMPFGSSLPMGRVKSCADIYLPR